MERLAVSNGRSPVTRQDVRPQQRVHLLWTGGWDSTYRLLDLVLRRRVSVQPWYVRDEERASTPLEISVMAAITDAIARRDPEAARLLQPIHFVDREEIAPRPELTVMCDQLHLGSQYEWLARLVHQQELSSFEIGIEKRSSRVYEMLWHNVEPVEGVGGRTFRLKPAVTDPNLELFRNFEFPVLHLTKSDLRQRAQARGWVELMSMTWFCHDPRAGKPCGMCTPCMVALEEGFGERIPILRRVRPRLRLLKKKVLEQINSYGRHA